MRHVTFRFEPRFSVRKSQEFSERLAALDRCAPLDREKLLGNAEKPEGRRRDGWLGLPFNLR